MSGRMDDLDALALRRVMFAVILNSTAIIVLSVAVSWLAVTR